MTTITNSPFFSAALAVVASGAMLTFAVAPAEAASVPVRVAAYELATAEGRAAVDGRLARAAERACGYDQGAKGLTTRAQAKACIAQALDDARVQVAQVKAASQMASK